MSVGFRVINGVWWDFESFGRIRGVVIVGDVVKMEKGIFKTFHSFKNSIV